jgi:UPF0716 family protein affecting phage T7 exclusion
VILVHTTVVAMLVAVLAVLGLRIRLALLPAVSMLAFPLAGRRGWRTVAVPWIGESRGDANARDQQPRHDRDVPNQNGEPPHERIVPSELGRHDPYRS